MLKILKKLKKNVKANVIVVQEVLYIPKLLDIGANMIVDKCTDKIFDRVKAGQSACDDNTVLIIKPIGQTL